MKGSRLKVKKSTLPSPPLTSFNRIISFVTSNTSQSSAISSSGFVAPKLRFNSSSVSSPIDVDQTPFVVPDEFVAVPVLSVAKLKVKSVKSIVSSTSSKK